MDDDLLRRMKAIDPAREVPPLPLTHHVEAIMTRTTERPRRPWATRIAVAATTLAVAGGGAFAVNSWLGEDSTVTAAPTRVSLEGDAAGAMAMCIQMSPEALAPAESAFSGTVTAVSGGVATLEVDHWYKGGDADLVDVNSIDAEQYTSEFGVAFEVGERYLVTASGGMVSGCLSAGYDDATAAMFAQAFEG